MNKQDIQLYPAKLCRMGADELSAETVRCKMGDMSIVPNREWSGMGVVCSKLCVLKEMECGR